MRPEILNPLFTEVEALKGVGPQIAKLLKKLGVSRLVDLLYHLPTATDFVFFFSVSSSGNMFDPFVIARSEATKQSMFPQRRNGLLRGVYHRARFRATRWLAMTALST